VADSGGGVTTVADPQALMLVAVASRRLAMHGSGVSEIARVAMVTPVPCDDPAILGVAVHRGRIVPLLDLRRRLGDGATGLPPWLCLFMHTSGGDVGVPIDAVLGFGATGNSRLPEGVTFVDFSILGARDGAGAPY